jgi:uracil phosphoribosyltransferase
MSLAPRILRYATVTVSALAALHHSASAAADGSKPSDPRASISSSAAGSSAAGSSAADSSAAGSAALHPNLVVLQSRALTALFTVIRDEETEQAEFSAAADRLMRLLAEEGLTHLPGVRERTVRTPVGVYSGLSSPLSAPGYSGVTAVSIVRAGDALLEAVRRVQPGISAGKILIQRDEASAGKEPKLFYVKLPLHIAGRQVLLVDPMLATGQSASCAIDVLLTHGVKEADIVFLNVVSCPEGLAHLARKHPAVRVVTAAVDSGLNEARYIIPGLGDFGDRYFGTTNSG